MAVKSHAGDLAFLKSPSGCTYHDPELSISPTVAQWAVAGTPVEFTVIVTNTSSTHCDLSNFELSVIAPPGWDAELDSETLQIAPDWSTGVLELVVTSPAQEQNGYYDITISAANKSLAIESAATATYVVDHNSNSPQAASRENAASNVPYFEASESVFDDAISIADEGTITSKVDTCIHNVPALQLAPVASGEAPETILRYLISLTNNDHPACADSHFDLTVTFLPEGWKGSLSNRQLYLSPGKSGEATLAVTRSPDTPSGSYKLQVGALDARSPKHVRTSTTRYVVNNASSLIGDKSPLKLQATPDRVTSLLID